MLEIKGAHFVLAVHDLEASTTYYTESLGFNVLGSPPGWSFLSRGSFKVMLGQCEDAIPVAKLGDHSYFAYINVEDAEKLYNEYLQNEVNIRKELTSEPWGMKEFSIQTIDGHRIMFGEDIES